MKPSCWANSFPQILSSLKKSGLLWGSPGTFRLLDCWYLALSFKEPGISISLGNRFFHQPWNFALLQFARSDASLHIKLRHDLSSSPWPTSGLVEGHTTSLCSTTLETASWVPNRSLKGRHYVTGKKWVIYYMRVTSVEWSFHFNI